MSPRKSRDTPTSSGVYQILCKQNGKIYVGSSINLEWRWHSHRRDLRNGVHVNPHLQFAWNLYGETSFEFSVVEYVDEQRLLVTAQLWINKTRCTDRSIGFNIKLEATAAGQEIGRTWHGFHDPTGLATFCRDHGLDNTHMTAVARGRIISHRGWTHVRGRKRTPPLVHRGYIAPGGAHVRITNLAAFCRACGLSVVHMHQLKSGERPSHKGWTWKYDADKAFE